MTDLRTTLKKKLFEHNLSASALEKKAGIRPSSLQNLLQGRSKNPSVEILKLTARALNCTVSELLGETSGHPQLEPFLASTPWNQALYIEIAQIVFGLYAEKGLQTSKRTLLTAIEQAYTFCLQYNKVGVDKDFVDWTILRLLQSEQAGD